MKIITNEGYITIKREPNGEIGIFIGDKPAMIYHGAKIEFIDDIKCFFNEIQDSNSEVSELHIGAFDTDGIYGKIGTPSGNFGPNMWCRVKVAGKDASPNSWVFCCTRKMINKSIESGVYECAELVCRNAYFQSKVVNAANTATDAETISNIPDSECITVNRNGIFVGGTPATYYRGVKIGSPENINPLFQTIQNRYPNIRHMCFLTSKMTGEFNKPGNPVAENGDNLWARITFFDGYVGPWVLVEQNCPYDFSIAHISGNLCRMVDNYVFLDPLLGRYQDVVIRINLQNMAGKSVELNGYKITIEKIVQPQQER